MLILGTALAIPASGRPAILLGVALVFFLFPTKDREQALLAQYRAEDAQGSAEPAAEPALAATAAR
jgi:hypothetical protein